ncbi:MAG: VanZ family protein [Thermoleophilia bacterium]
MSAAAVDLRAWRAAAMAWAAVVVLFGVLPTQAAVHAFAGEREDVLTSGGHFLEYAVLAALVALASSSSGGGRRTLLNAFAGAVGLGAAVELVQAPLPYRDFQIGDLAVDAAGAAVALLLFSLGAWAAARPPRSRRG